MLPVTVCTVGYVCLFRRVEIFMDFVTSLSIIIDVEGIIFAAPGF